MDFETFKPVLVGLGVAGILLLFQMFLLVTAGIGWLMVTLLFKGEASFRRLFSFHLHLSVLYTLSLAVSVLGVAGFGLDPKTPVTNLANIISAHGALKGFLSVFEVFTIWCLILSRATFK